MKTHPVDGKKENEEGSHLREGTGEIVGTCVAFRSVATEWGPCGKRQDMFMCSLLCWPPGVSRLGDWASSGPHRGPSQTRQVMPVE